MKAATYAGLVSLGLAAAVSQVLAAGPAEIVIPGERSRPRASPPRA